MHPKTISYLAAKKEFSKIIEESYYSDLEPIYIVLDKIDGNKYNKKQTYVFVKILSYLKVHFVKKALIRMIYNTFLCFKSFSMMAQVFLPTVKRDSSYSSYYTQSHLDDVLLECESIIVFVENKHGEGIGVLMPLELYKMMF